MDRQTVSNNVTEESGIQAINAGEFFLSNDIWNDPKIPKWCVKILPDRLKSMAVFDLMIM
jgi:hypothetical protein